MINQLFSVSGSKISSLVVGENSLMFSSQNHNSVDAFNEAWGKTLSLATTVEIKYEAIKSVKKEDTDDDIMIKYKAFAGLPSECEFAFAHANDATDFFNFLEKQQYFSKSHETLSPFKAILGQLIGLAITLAVTTFAYFEAINLTNGTANESVRGKARMFDAVVGFLGDKGVLAVGGLISCLLLYTLWKRFKNPPNQLTLRPPNA